MTEDEGRTKWCPFVRLTADGGEWHVNRHPGDPQEKASYQCIGSACMAWRWEYNPLDSQRTSHGFCGLAGRPA